jgi:7-cyano-7-deazaguanine synthase
MKAVVLLSGGMDSAVAAAQAQKEGRKLYALTLQYGQRHARELQAARQQARDLKISAHQILNLPLQAIAAGSLLTGGPIRAGKRSGGLPATYVSFRNGVFLSVALSWAEALGAKEVWGGWCETDYAGYPDCRPSFFRAMEKAVAEGSKAGLKGKKPFVIRSPLTGLTKVDTVRLGLKLDVDFSHTWTCYNGGKKPCMKCDACLLREEGFKKAGAKDPLP